MRKILAVIGACIAIAVFGAPVAANASVGTPHLHESPTVRGLSPNRTDSSHLVGANNLNHGTDGIETTPGRNMTIDNFGIPRLYDNIYHVLQRAYWLLPTTVMSSKSRIVRPTTGLCG